ncbi:MAG: hypothetical protein NWE82_00195 [Candidatus Bathyarchaeota archaeon]|nr:hypothetical protein [Candidatus Bathyarchaeota archaeon]
MSMDGSLAGEWSLSRRKEGFHRLVIFAGSVDSVRSVRSVKWLTGPIVVGPFWNPGDHGEETVIPV